MKAFKALSGCVKVGVGLEVLINSAIVQFNLNCLYVCVCVCVQVEHNDNPSN